MQKEILEADQKNQVAGIKMKMSKLVTWLFDKFHEEGTNYVETNAGTARVVPDDRYVIDDLDEFFKFAKTQDDAKMLMDTFNNTLFSEYTNSIVLNYTDATGNPPKGTSVNPGPGFMDIRRPSRRKRSE